MTRVLGRALLYLGTVAIVLVVSRFHARYIGHYSITESVPGRVAWTLALVGALCLASYGAGLPDLPRSARTALTSAVGAAVGGAAVFGAVQILAGDALLPRFVVFGSALLLIPWSLVCVLLATDSRGREARRDRVVVVAEASEAAALAVQLDAAPERPAVLVAALGVLDAVPGAVGPDPLVDRARQVDATVVVLDRRALAEPAVVAQAAALHETGVRVRSLADFYDQWLGKLPVSELERASLFFDIREIHGTRYLRLKRLIDVILGLGGLVVMLVVVPLVMVGDLIANRGPLFFRQERVGKNGHGFEILKFRTMVAEHEAAGEWTVTDDPRVTPFGRFLRRTHLDELPQVLNVLRGDLSLVGPRPEQPRYVEELTRKLPFYPLRHLVRPGLTGWAQVKHGYAGDDEDALEKLQYEFWYLSHQRLRLDVRIVGRTARAVLRGGGR